MNESNREFILMLPLIFGSFAAGWWMRSAKEKRARSAGPRGIIELVP